MVMPMSSTYQPASVQPRGEVREKTQKELDTEEEIHQLKPFLAAVTNMNPDKPMDPADMVRMANELHFMRNTKSMSRQMEDMAKSHKDVVNASAVNMIGSRIEGFGSFIELKQEDEGMKAQIPFELPHDVKHVRVEIFDANGQSIIELSGDNKKGTHLLNWDGKDLNGKEYPADTYSYAVTAIDKSGRPLEIKSFSQGVVTGINFKDDGAYLRVGGGTEMPLHKVRSIIGKTNAAAAAA